MAEQQQRNRFMKPLLREGLVEKEALDASRPQGSPRPRLTDDPVSDTPPQATAQIGTIAAQIGRPSRADYDPRRRLVKREGSRVCEATPEALAGSIRRVMDDQPFAERLGAAAAARVETMTWAATVKRLVIVS